MEEPANNRQPYSCVKSCIISLAVILSCPMGVLILALIAPYVHQHDYIYVGEKFAQALMHNNLGLARRFTAPSQWDRIDIWMSTHEPFRCPLSWDFDDYRLYSTGGLIEEGSSVSFFHSCWVDEYYEFEIEEIILRRHEGRWQVVDWSGVRETR